MSNSARHCELRVDPPQLAYAFFRASKNSQRMALEKETAVMKTTREKALSDGGTVRTERSTSASR